MTDEEIIAEGFKPWHGGKIPDDYDDLSKVLILDAERVEARASAPEHCWMHMPQYVKVIGYCTKQSSKPNKITIPDGPAPDWAVKRFAQLVSFPGPDNVSVGAHLVAMLEEPLYDALKAVVEMGRYDTREQVALLREELDKRGLTIAAKEQSND